jgi:hypothetical protein
MDLLARPFDFLICLMDMARVEVCSQAVEASTAFAKLISIHSDDPIVQYLVSSFNLIVQIIV